MNRVNQKPVGTEHVRISRDGHETVIVTVFRMFKS